MPTQKQSSMADDVREILAELDPPHFLRKTRHHGTGFQLALLKQFAEQLLVAVLSGEVGRTTVKDLASQFVWRIAAAVRQSLLPDGAQTTAV